MERAFNCDWERALHYGIGEYVRKNHDDNDAGEVEKVRRCLLSNVWLVYSAFDYLASLGSGGINAINSNAFLSFIKEAKLVDPASTNCKAAHLDQLFVLINSLEPPSERQSRRASPTLAGDGAKRPATPIASAPTTAAPPAAAPAAAPPLAPMLWGKARAVTKVVGLHSSVRTFERHEWLQALVRIAIMRYVLKGTRSTPRIAGVSEAVQVLLTKDVVPNLPPELTQTSFVSASPSAGASGSASGSSSATSSPLSSTSASASDTPSASSNREDGGFTKTMCWCRGLAMLASAGISASGTVNRQSLNFLLKRLTCG
jgi:hypothetical protein